MRISARASIACSLLLSIAASRSAHAWLQPGNDHDDDAAELAQLRLDLIEDEGFDVVPGQWIVAFKAAATRPVAEGGFGYAVNANGFMIPPADLDARINAIEPLEQSAAVEFNAEQVRREPGDRRVYQPLLPRTFVIHVPENQRDAVAALRQRPDVLYVEPVRRLMLSTTWGTANPNDALLAQQWAIDSINARGAWEAMAPAPSDIRVAVFDGGRVSQTHPDLQANRLPAADRDNRGVDSHAVHVAGIIAATGNNGIGVAGIANVRLLSFDPGGVNTSFANAIALAANDGVDVINMSFYFCSVGPNGCIPGEYAPFSQTHQNAINAAADQIVFVAGAGNDGQNTDSHGRMPYPAAYDNVLGVSAVNASHVKAGFSNFGSYIDLAAPGVNIYSTVGNNGYESWDGTSMACPMVAGAAAAIRQLLGASAAETRQLLVQTAVDLGPAGRDDNYGHGLVNVSGAAIPGVWVDFNYAGTETGSFSQPYNTLQEAVNAVPTGGTIRIKSGSTSEAITITKRLTIQAVDGNVTIGN